MGERSKLYILLGLTIATLLLGTFVYHFLEHWSYIDSLYFCTTTLTTVGYGDLHPTTDISKIFTILYILSGIGIILSFINVLAEKRVERQLIRRTKK